MTVKAVFLLMDPFSLLKCDFDNTNVTPQNAYTIDFAVHVLKIRTRA